MMPDYTKRKNHRRKNKMPMGNFHEKNQGVKLVIDLRKANRWYIQEVKEKLENMGLRVKEEK